MSTKRTSKKSGATKSTRSRTTKTTNKRKSTKGKSCYPPNRFFCAMAVGIIGIAATVFVTILTMFALAGCITYSQSDARRFAAEYSTVSVDNPFVYKTGQEVIDILEHGTGVVFLGFPSCPWCQSYAGMLADVAKDAGLKTINYYNIYDARQNNTEEYQKLVSLLGANLQYDENGQRRIYVPDTVFVVDGRIVGNDLESSKDTAGESDPNNYWTEDRVNALKSRLSTYAKQVVDASTDCNDTCNK